MLRILISTNIDLFRRVTGDGDQIHLCKSATDISRALNTSPVHVWICHGDEVSLDLLNLWLDQPYPTEKSIMIKSSQAASRIQESTNGRAIRIVGWPDQNPMTRSMEEHMLQVAEKLYSKTLSSILPQPMSFAQWKNRQQTVIFVGAGIMNLTNAHYLITHGYRVRVVDAGPNPQLPHEWSRLGTTHSGGDARMFTRTEADNYNEIGSSIYADMRDIFRHTVRQGGWSVKLPNDFTTAELGWVNAFETVPPWMARAFKEDIHKINGESGRLWSKWMQASPHLFQNVGLHKDILRMYVEPNALDASIQLNHQYGTIVTTSTLEQFLSQYPEFAGAAETDHLAGAFVIEGFTLNIHRFVAKLTEEIVSLGGAIQWNNSVRCIRRNLLGQVEALETESGQRLEADHYVVCPGVTGNELLKDTKSVGLIQGVLGIWLQIPNLEPRIKSSIKLHRRGHLVEDINITIATDPDTEDEILMLGGGYGYVGFDRPSPDNPELKALFDEMENVASIYFPKNYAIAKQTASLWPGGHRKFCIRPFTPTGLGVFETIPTAAGGKLIISGGNNTGGFAQAPAIARAVHHALIGEHNPIHGLFHPDRGRFNCASKLKYRLPVSRLSQNTDTRKPLKLLLLCSDGPQHAYLRYLVEKNFPEHWCIVESNEGQIRHLKKKGRKAEAWYMRYHSLRRRLLGLSHQRQAYFDWLIPPGFTLPSPDLIVDTLNCREVWKAVEEWQPEVTIVSGTKYIGKKLNERGGLMINLHTGHLPDYKGNHCIFFALYDRAIDKVGATLHLLTPNLDGGAILDKVYPPILSNDTEETLYTRCLHMAIDRCIEHLIKYSMGEQLEFVAQKDAGKTYRHCDRTPWKELTLWWRMQYDQASKISTFRRNSKGPISG